MQSTAGLSWPCQERLQALRSSTRTSASISAGGGSSKSDVKPQPDTRHRVPAKGGLAPLRGKRSRRTAGPRTAEPFSCGRNAGISAAAPLPQGSPAGVPSHSASGLRLDITLQGRVLVSVGLPGVPAWGLCNVSGYSAEGEDGMTKPPGKD